MKNKIDSILKEPYHIINLSFAGIIMLIFIYSGIFCAEKDNHPIKSACANIDGHPCKSEGLSRSFSEIVRFNLESAKSYNKYGLQIFSFFLIQLLMRFATSYVLYKKAILKSNLIIIDSVISACLYMYCFWGMIF
ncbi:MAG TPA: hypothetical protein DCG75_14105 [Bacteroidales bacterium]|jgi:hypothetical protein|nr:hypothetical protein [Bacteroidales bacterium]